MKRTADYLWWKRFFPQIIRRAWLFLVILSLSHGCAGIEPAPRLAYELLQVAYAPELVSPLQLQPEGSTLVFTVAFKAGGGSYEKACIVYDETEITIQLSDTDGKLQDMWVIYQLSGSITGLNPGEYSLIIEDSNHNQLAGGTFSIQ